MKFREQVFDQLMLMMHDVFGGEYNEAGDWMSVDKWCDDDVEEAGRWPCVEEEAWPIVFGNKCIQYSIPITFATYRSLRKFKHTNLTTECTI